MRIFITFILILISTSAFADTCQSVSAGTFDSSVPHKTVANTAHPNGCDVALSQSEQTQLAAGQAAFAASLQHNKLISDTKKALAEDDKIAIRTAKAGGNYASATAWVVRDVTLRQIINGTNPGPIPDYPRNLDGSISYP